MKPDESYTKIQKRLLHLIKINDRTGERGQLKSQLEKKFMTAWQFTSDRRRLGYKLGEAVRIFRTEADKCVGGFDHRTYYTGENDQRIIVVQPYGVFPSEILQDLTLSNGVCPEVIDATEWAFYYPKNTNLIIIKFPFGFREAMQNFEIELQQAKNEKALRTRECESVYLDV